MTNENLFRNISVKDPFYLKTQPNYEDLYYENFNENDLELRDILRDDKEESDSDDFDLDSDFGNWL
jgi:hypothetical protein